MLLTGDAHVHRNLRRRGPAPLPARLVVPMIYYVWPRNRAHAARHRNLCPGIERRPRLNLRRQEERPVDVVVVLAPTAQRAYLAVRIPPPDVERVPTVRGRIDRARTERLNIERVPTVRSRGCEPPVRSLFLFHPDHRATLVDRTLPTVRATPQPVLAPELLVAVNTERCGTITRRPRPCGVEHLEAGDLRALGAQ